MQQQMLPRAIKKMERELNMFLKPKKFYGRVLGVYLQKQTLHLKTGQIQLHGQQAGRLNQDYKALVRQYVLNPEFLLQEPRQRN
jgi:hypothetical protein